MSKRNFSSIKPQVSTMRTLKVAIVHDWLTNMGGAEPLLLEMHKLFPDAPIYTSVYDKDKLKAFAGIDIRTTYLQRLLPKFLRYKHTLWPVLRAHAFRKLDMSEYDVIISSSTAESKSVKKRPGALHICYCNTPTRYYWSHYEEFKKSFNFGILNIFIKPVIPIFVRWMRRLDLRSVKGVDYFIANSNEVKRRIKKYYDRDSTVIFPAVDTKKFADKQKSNVARKGFVTWGRHVPYKRFDLAVQACTELSLPLTVIGSGPETDKLKAMAGPTIHFVGRVSDKELVRLAHSAEAFLFPGEEDFGIAPVEAMAAGLPVIAYKSGGALDYVVEGKTGVFFKEQTTKSLINALRSFNTKDFKSVNLVSNGEQFAVTEFLRKFENYTNSAIQEWKQK